MKLLKKEDTSLIGKMTLNNNELQRSNTVLEIIKGVLRWLGAVILLVLCAAITILILFIAMPDNAIKAIEILKSLQI